MGPSKQKLNLEPVISARTMKEQKPGPKKPTKEQLSAQVQNLEVACAELATLLSGRTAYEKRGSLFFRTDVKILNTSQQRELKKVKARLEKL
ncbi:hypothetical protein R1flu_000846 [Riccia fluitans]|uniref:Uncharacterized protein n=1 Tax=Riccia fluitans TaxID=41844 RepID=A0ABD1Y1Y8_9MARC